MCISIVSQSAIVYANHPNYIYIESVDKPVGKQPRSIAVNPDTNKTYVANYGSNDVTVIYGENDTFIENIPTGKQPISIAIDPVYNKVFVANYGSNDVTVIDTTNNEIIGEPILTGKQPISIAVNTKTHVAYVANYGSNNVTVIDTTNNNFIKNISTGKQPISIAVNLNKNLTYVANLGSNSVAVINSNHQHIYDYTIKQPKYITFDNTTDNLYTICYTSRICIANTTLDTDKSDTTIKNVTKYYYSSHVPTGMAVDPRTNSLYLSISNLYSLFVMDTKTGMIKNAFMVERYPLGVAINDKKQNLYVANNGSNSVTIMRIDAIKNNPIEDNSQIKNLANSSIFHDGPTEMAIHPISGDIYIASYDSGSVSIIDTNNHRVKKELVNTKDPATINKKPTGIDIDTKTNDLYVSNYGNHSVSVFNNSSNTPVDTKFIGPATDVGIDSKNKAIYVTIYKDAKESVPSPSPGYIFIKDLDKFKPGNNYSNKSEYFKINPRPESIAVNHKTDEIYVANFDDNTISVINNANHPFKNISVGSNPYEIAINPETNNLYVSNFDDDTVSVIDTKYYEKISDIRGFDGPSDIAINPETNMIYVANSLSNYVSKIDGRNNTVVENITSGPRPESIAINPETNLLYVGVYGHNSISVINVNGTKHEPVYPKETRFNIIPSNSGFITCNHGEGMLTNHPYFLSINSTCKAEANTGYYLSSWVKKVGQDSTRIINSSVLNYPPLFGPIFELMGYPNIKETNDFKILSPGTYVTNFEKKPSPVPPEYSVPLFAIVFSTVIGLFVPGLVNFIRRCAYEDRIKSFHIKIANLYEDDLNKKDLQNLDGLTKEISNSYVKGKIKNESYTNLKDELSLAYEEIFSKALDSIRDTKEKDEKKRILAEVENNISKSYSKGKLTEFHYRILKDKIIHLTSNL